MISDGKACAAAMRRLRRGCLRRGSAFESTLAFLAVKGVRECLCACALAAALAL